MMSHHINFFGEHRLCHFDGGTPENHMPLLFPGNESTVNRSLNSLHLDNDDRTAIEREKGRFNAIVDRIRDLDTPRTGRISQLHARIRRLAAESDGEQKRQLNDLDRKFSNEYLSILRKGERERYEAKWRMGETSDKEEYLNNLVNFVQLLELKTKEYENFIQEYERQLISLEDYANLAIAEAESYPPIMSTAIAEEDVTHLTSIQRPEPDIAPIHHIALPVAGTKQAVGQESMLVAANAPFAETDPFAANELSTARWDGPSVLATNSMTPRTAGPIVAGEPTTRIRTVAQPELIPVTTPKTRTGEKTRAQEDGLNGNVMLTSFQSTNPARRVIDLPATMPPLSAARENLAPVDIQDESSVDKSPVDITNIYDTTDDDILDEGLRIVSQLQRDGSEGDYDVLREYKEFLTAHPALDQDGSLRQEITESLQSDLKTRLGRVWEFIKGDKQARARISNNFTKGTNPDDPRQRAMSEIIGHIDELGNRLTTKEIEWYVDVKKENGLLPGIVTMPLSRNSLLIGTGYNNPVGVEIEHDNGVDFLRIRSEPETERRKASDNLDVLDFIAEKIFKEKIDDLYARSKSIMMFADNLKKQFPEAVRKTEVLSLKEISVTFQDGTMCRIPLKFGGNAIDEKFVLTGIQTESDLHMLGYRFLPERRPIEIVPKTDRETLLVKRTESVPRENNRDQSVRPNTYVDITQPPIVLASTPEPTAEASEINENPDSVAEFVRQLAKNFVDRNGGIIYHWSADTLLFERTTGDNPVYAEITFTKREGKNVIEAHWKKWSYAYESFLDKKPITGGGSVNLVNQYSLPLFTASWQSFFGTEMELKENNKRNFYHSSETTERSERAAAAFIENFRQSYTPAKPFRIVGGKPTTGRMNQSKGGLRIFVDDETDSRKTVHGFDLTFHADYEHLGVLHVNVRQCVPPTPGLAVSNGAFRGGITTPLDSVGFDVHSTEELARILEEKYNIRFEKNAGRTDALMLAQSWQS